MYVFTPASKFKDSGFSCFNYFLFTNTGLEYFRRLSFKITFLGEPLEGIPGQSLTKSVLTVASIVSKTSSTINSLSFTFLEMCRSDSSLQNLVFSSFRWFFSSSWLAKCLTKFCSIFWFFKKYQNRAITQFKTLEVQLSYWDKVLCIFVYLFVFHMTFWHFIWLFTKSVDVCGSFTQNPLK